MPAAPLSDDDHALLRDAAEGKHACIDLRYEGGPWIDRLDALVARGLLEARDADPAYMVSYRITAAGRAALGE